MQCHRRANARGDSKLEIGMDEWFCAVRKGSSFRPTLKIASQFPSVIVHHSTLSTSLRDGHSWINKHDLSILNRFHRELSALSFKGTRLASEMAAFRDELICVLSRTESTISLFRLGMTEQRGSLIVWRRDETRRLKHLKSTCRSRRPLPGRVQVPYPRGGPVPPRPSATWVRAGTSLP